MAKAQTARQRHRFAVHACGITFEVYAEDYETSDNGAYFSDKVGTPEEFAHTFVSHPCIVQQERPGAPFLIDDAPNPAGFARQDPATSVGHN